MDKSTIKRLLNYMLKSKGLLVIALVCAILSVVLNLMGPILIGKSIDSMIGIKRVDFNTIFKILITLGIIYILSSIFTWILTYVTNKVSYNTVNILRKELFDKINSLPLKFFDNTSHGDVINRFINDIDAIGDGMVQVIATFLSGIVTIIGSICFMISINYILTGIVIVSAFITFFMAKFITSKTKKHFTNQAKYLGNLNGYVEEIISGQKTVKAFGYEKRSINKFREMNQELYNAGVRSQFYGSLANPSTRVVNNIAYSIVGMSGSIIAIAGAITIGDISSFLIYSNLFSKPFNEITGVFTQIQSAIASAKRVFEIIDIKSEDKDLENAIELKDSKGNIVFRDVEFSYQKDKPLITKLNLDVKSGQKIAIVGKTGAGKTTLVNLLMRFYDINKGSILVDGIDINKIKKDSLRKSFGMVLQETFLFEGSIKDNISYGTYFATDEDIINASKEVGAHSFIKRLPNGYDTIINSSGGNLSQGQKQLLTIARVMIVNPPILILDEATSNIDTRTEIKVQRAFQKVMEGKTTFIIAHRLSTIKEADNILVMDKGNIVESGVHEELLSLNGHYASIYNSQFAVE